MYGASNSWGCSLLQMSKLYILLAISYAFKWVEAITNPKNDSYTMVKYFKNDILTQFEAPRSMISDRGSHFCNKILEKLMERYGI